MAEKTKKIFFNKSILLNLKAELSKKQEEVNKKKHLPQHKVQNFKARCSDVNNTDKNQVSNEKKSLRNKLTAIDTDELEASRKSKLALEKKAELYEHLADSTGISQLTDNFLVNFKEKKLQESTQVQHNQTFHEDVSKNIENEDDWVEFTDCLGRTRKCLKSDLEFYKKRDKLLAETTSSVGDESTNQSSEAQQSEKTLLVQKTNDYLQSLRDNWEQKERELLAKDGDIHYQDLLFDEARIHGVGYYSFSTDEKERKKQMEELLKSRKETLQAQEQAEEARKKREELIAARVAATRARQRARAGLPPEDPQEKQKNFTKCLLELLTKQKNEADSKAKEEENKEREEREKERQKVREAFVREWDIGKDGVGGKVKKFQEMTQEEYVEQQRSKRIEEFAPFQDNSTPKSKSSYVFDKLGKKVDSSVASEVKKTWSDVRPVESTSPIDLDAFNDPPKGLSFSTKKPEKTVKYRNFVQEAIPIQNELDNTEKDQDVKNQASKRKSQDNNVAIPPPPTFEYYGPVSKRVKSQKPFHSDLNEAYAQGSRSLEPKDAKMHLSKQYDFTFD